MIEPAAESTARLAELTELAAGLYERKPVEAQPWAEEAVDLARSLGDQQALARNLFVLGSCRIAAAEYGAAESNLRAALDAAQAIEDRKLVVETLRGLLKCGFYSRNADAALLRGMQALQVARDLGDARSLAFVHNDLGLIYGNGGDYESALEHLLAGLRLIRKTGEPRLASLLNNIGNVYFELGDYREALSFFRSALESFQEEGAARGAGIALGNIGRASRSLEDHAAAVDAYRQSLAIYEESEDLIYMPAALARLGTALSAVERFEEAKGAFEAAFDALETFSHREFEDEVLTAAGLFALSQGDLDRAITLLTRALSVLPPGETSQRVYALHEALAEAYEGKGALDEALREYKEFHRVRQAVSDSAVTVRIRGLMLQFDVERARQQEEIFRLRNVELARANEDLHELQGRLEAKNRELHQISIEDALTGLHNRRYLDMQMDVELRRARRHDRPLCVAMCDIDHFKPINDRYSHALGDEVLRRIAVIFRESARVTDIVSRYGGEEFLLVLPDTDLAGAEVLMERIRLGVAEHPWEELEKDLRVTLSIGVTQFNGTGPAVELLTAADERLYAAKKAGRNRVES